MITNTRKFNIITVSYDGSDPCPELNPGTDYGAVVPVCIEVVEEDKLTALTVKIGSNQFMLEDLKMVVKHAEQFYNKF